MPEDKKSLVSGRLPEHESGVRRMIADAGGTAYKAFLSLAEAKSDGDGVVVFEGDWGGQIYLVARASYVQCSEAVLRQLVLDLDARQWKDPDAARVYYERQPVGSGISGGMGGGVVLPDVWVHDRLRGLEGTIRRVLTGEQVRLEGQASCLTTACSGPGPRLCSELASNRALGGQVMGDPGMRIGTPPPTDGLVTLTAFVPSDAPVLCDGDRDREHRRWFEFPDDFVPSIQHSLEAIARWAEERIEGKRFSFAVRDAVTDTLLSGCELRPRADEAANLSYWTYPVHRNRGIASRAVALACQVAFGDFGFRRVEVLTDPDNAPSRLVAIRNGFRVAGMRDGRILHVLEAQWFTNRQVVS